MLGLRGVRLGLVIPGLFAMQVRAIAEAAAAVQARRAATRGRRSWCRWSARSRSWRWSATRPSRSSPRWPRDRRRVDMLIGTMIELPRAALTAGQIAEAARVLLLRHQRPDPDGLGLLPRRRRGRVLLRATSRWASSASPRSRRSTATASAGWSGSPSRRAGRPGPDLKLGVCGEHGGDPDSVHFFHEVGPGLRLLLAVPGPGRPAGGRPRGRRDRRLRLPLTG